MEREPEKGRAAKQAIHDSLFAAQLCDLFDLFAGERDGLEIYSGIALIVAKHKNGKTILIPIEWKHTEWYGNTDKSTNLILFKNLPPLEVVMFFGAMPKMNNFAVVNTGSKVM